MNAVDSSSWQHTNVDSRLVTLLRYTIDIDALHCTSNIGAVGYHCKQKVQVDWSEAALVGTCCAASQQMCDIARNRLLLVVAGDYRFLAIIGFWRYRSAKDSPFPCQSCLQRMTGTKITHENRL